MARFAPIAKTNLCPKAEFKASDLKPGGSVLEAESDGKVVRITHRGIGFLLIREHYAMTLVAEPTDTTPKALEQLLKGFTADDTPKRQPSASTPSITRRRRPPRRCPIQSAPIMRAVRKANVAPSRAPNRFQVCPNWPEQSTARQAE